MATSKITKKKELKVKKAKSKKPVIKKKKSVKKVIDKSISTEKDISAHKRKKMKKRIKAIIEEMGKIKDILKDVKAEGLDTIVDLPTYEEHVEKLTNLLNQLNQKIA
jgi:hypothetical protein